MSDDATPRLSLPYLAAGQAQKHVTLNEALSLLDGLVQTAAESRAVDAQPASPDDGALYIMTASPSGADWAGQAQGAVMRFEAGAWAVMTVNEGCVAWIKDEATAVAWDGADWVAFTSLPDAFQNLDLMGVNTTADATNKLAVASAAVLFNHVGAGSQVKVNKAAAADTASHLFQTGFSGRAEFGLTGSDDFTLKVSPDGSTWHDVLVVDKDTGEASFTALAVDGPQVDVFTSSGTYSVPAWAKRLLVTVTGGGGGGGSAAAGSNAANRGGGGGGAGGGRIEEWFEVGELASSLSVTIGAGGLGSAGVTGNTAGLLGQNGSASSVSSAGAVVLMAGGGGFGGGGASGSGGAAGEAGVGRGFGNPAGAGSAGLHGGYGIPNDAIPTGVFPDFAGPGSGGGGAGVNTGDGEGLGGPGGYGYLAGGAGRRAAGGAQTSAGVPAGFNGASKPWPRGGGGGGSGGGSMASGDGGDGGHGGLPGGGGGGGGACRNTATSGSGGNGGRGEVVIIAFG